MTRATIDSQFIVRFLKNDLTQEEDELFKRWLSESDSHAEEVASIAEVWDTLGRPDDPEPVAVDKAWEQMERRMSSLEFRQTPPAAARPFVLWHTLTTVRVAASVIFIAGIALGALLLTRMSNKRETVQPAVVHEISTKNGQRLTVLFPDGSVAYLNAGSRLRYPDSFGNAERLIEMEGEAYFTVAHDPLRPFRIVTGAATTEVIGTEFNLRWRDSLYELTVAKGTVRSSNRITAYRLVRGDHISYDAVHSSFSRVEKAKFGYALAWRENKLAFEHATLEQAMKELELWYDVHTVFESTSATKKTLSGVFRTESLDEILSNIAFALNVRVVRNGKTIQVK